MVPVIGLALVITGVVLLLLSFRPRVRTPAESPPQPQPQLRLLGNTEPLPVLPSRSRTASARTSLRLVVGFKS